MGFSLSDSDRSHYGGGWGSGTATEHSKSAPDYTGSDRDVAGQVASRAKLARDTAAKAAKAKAAAAAKAKKKAASAAFSKKVNLMPDVTPPSGPMIGVGAKRSVIKDYFQPMDRTTVTGGVRADGAMNTSTRSQSLAQNLGGKLLSALPGLSVDIRNVDGEQITDTGFSPLGFVGGVLGMVSPIPGGSTILGKAGEMAGEAMGSNVDVDESYETGSLVTNEPTPSAGATYADRGPRDSGSSGGVLTQAAAAPLAMPAVQAAAPRGGYGGNQGLLVQAATEPSPYQTPEQRFGRALAGNRYVFDETLGRVVQV